MIRAAGVTAFGTIIAALATLALLSALGDETSEGISGHEDAVSGGATGDLLRWSTRDSLAVCVELSGAINQTRGPLNAAEIQDMIDALRDVGERPYFDRSDRLKSAASQPQVHVGCPTDAIFECPDAARPPVVCDLGQVVEDPGPYVLHIFVMSNNDLARVLGHETLRRGSGDVVCHLDNCFEVTAKLYLTSEELTDQSFLEEVLLEALGLEGSSQ
jgi:hypothetical protein